MRTPSISGCVPCFNAEATLVRALAGLRAQTMPLAEVIVIDDGSADRSAAVAREAGARVVALGANLGRGAARARALAESASGLVLFCDAGIAVPPCFLEQALARMESVKTAAVFGRIQPGAGCSVAERWRARHLFKAEAANRLETEAVLATGAVLLRREAVLAAGGFDARLREGEDADLGRRLLAAGFDVIRDPQIVSTALGSDSLWQLLERYARWNTAPGGRIGFRDYLRLASYSAKVMARADLRRGDAAAACISLACPHYQYWRARLKRS